MDASAVLRNSDRWWNQRVHKDWEEWRDSSRKMLQIEMSCATVRMREIRRTCFWHQCHSRPFLLGIFRRDGNLEENITITWKETLDFRELPTWASGKNHSSLCNLSLCFHGYLWGPKGVYFPKDQVCHSLLNLRSFLTFLPSPEITALCPSLYWPRYFLNSYINSSISQSKRKVYVFFGVFLGGFYSLVTSLSWELEPNGIVWPGPGRRGKRKTEAWIPYFTEWAVASP